ncbi:MAG: hypothetical protein ABI893_14655 [Polaromonas sp.]|uniref:hypothetical protein n=1 Tax=Polaromonas sp. TaxID=1869339 RepID=UPI003263336B
MNPLCIATEESYVIAAAMSEAQRLRALAIDEFWSAVGRWARGVAGRLARVGRRPRADAAGCTQAK